LRISFGKNSLGIRSWETESEMISFLQHCDGGSALLGQDAEQRAGFVSIDVQYNESPWPCFGVGMVSEGHGLSPQALLRPERQVVIIGLNKQIVGVDVDNREVCFEMDLDSLFFCFLSVDSLQIILVFHEIGVTAIKEDGSVIWQFSRDVIETWDIGDEWLSIEFVDIAPMRIHLVSGASEVL